MKTKKIFLAAIFFTAVAFDASAQKGWRIEFSIEPHSSMGGDFQVPIDVLNNNSAFVALNKKFRPGMDVGADAGYYFNDKASISIGVHYTSLGVDYKDYMWGYNGVTATLSKTIAMSYMKIPVLFHYVRPITPKISSHWAVGFYYGVLTNYRDESRVTSSNGSSVTLSAEDENIINTYSDYSGTHTEVATFTTKPFNSNDFGGIVNAGVQLLLSDKISLPVLLSYQVGFSNVKNKTSSYSYQGDTYLYWDDGMSNRPNLNLDYVNSSFGIKIGVLIKLGTSVKK
jgi:hypothetical protein